MRRLGLDRYVYLPVALARHFYEKVRNGSITIRARYRGAYVGINISVSTSDVYLIISLKPASLGSVDRFMPFQLVDELEILDLSTGFGLTIPFDPPLALLFPLNIVVIIEWSVY